MAGINLDANLGVTGFLKGTKDMEQALENVSDELDDVAKSGENDLEKLSDKLKEAKRATDALKDSGENVGKGVKKGAVEAEQATTVYKKEAISNISEVSSSFTGSWESAVDAVQGTLGGVVQDLSGIGLIAGAAGAVGVGLIGQALIKIEEKAKEAEMRVQELGDAFIATRDSSTPLETVIENLKKISKNSDDSRAKFKDLREEAKKIGIEAEGLALAYAGAEKPLKQQLAILQSLEAQTKNNIQAQKNGDKNFDLAASQKLAAIQRQIKGLQDVQKETDAAREIEQIYLSTGAGEMQNKVEAIKGINDAYDDAVGSVEDFVNKETGVLDVAAYIKSMEEREVALRNYQTSLAKSGLTDEQKTALNAMGIEASVAWMKGFESATPEQKESMKRFLTESAKESSGVAKTEIDNAFKSPIEQKLEVGIPTDIELTAKRKSIEMIIGKEIKIPVTFERVQQANPFGAPTP